MKDDFEKRWVPTASRLCFSLCLVVAMGQWVKIMHKKSTFGTFGHHGDSEIEGDQRTPGKEISRKK